MLINTIILFILTLSAHTTYGKTITPASQENCAVEHAGQKLTEGDSVDIDGKLYKVEDCELHRAYHACGTHILVIINIVCQAVEQHKIIPPKIRLRRFSKQKLLTEACCQHLCTVSEMTRYCPH
jgi:hypothetical protein